MIDPDDAAASAPRSEEGQDAARTQGAQQEPAACPKCGGQMQKGTLEGPTSSEPFAWTTSGRVAWTETPVARTLRSMFRRQRRQTLDLNTHRCSSCGYLEFYAR